MQLQDKRIRIKSGGFALLGAVIVGVGAITGAKMITARPEPIESYLDPTRWKFDVSSGAVARIGGGDAKYVQAAPTNQSLTAKGSAGAAFFDADQGFTVAIEKMGPRPDCVFLRNVIALDGIRDRKDLVFHFTARGDRPRPICIILRENDQVRWSQMVSVGTSWKQYRIPVSFGKFATYQGIVAVQMGYQDGTLSMKQLSLRSGG